MSKPNFARPHVAELLRRLAEPRRFIQVLAGARQVGKTTVARQAAERSGLPWRYASADEPTLRDAHWIAAQWDAARLLADEAGPAGALLVRPGGIDVATFLETPVGDWVGNIARAIQESRALRRIRAASPAWPRRRRKNDVRSRCRIFRAGCGSFSWRTGRDPLGCRFSGRLVFGLFSRCVVLCSSQSGRRAPRGHGTASLAAIRTCRKGSEPHPVGSRSAGIRG